MMFEIKEDILNNTWDLVTGEHPEYVRNRSSSCCFLFNDVSCIVGSAHHFLNACLPIRPTYHDLHR